ncbi:MAG: protein kinase [Elusimicrobia bacterium]|nr:protein kinase [Elusimicrobiota bacterium]
MNVRFALMLACIAALCFAQASLGPAAPDSSPNAEETNKLQEDISQLIDEMAPLLRRLDSMKEAYRQENAVLGIVPQRTALRADITERLRRLEKLEESYDKLRHEEDKIAIIGLIGSLNSDNPLADTSPAMDAAQRQVFSDKSSSFRSKTSDLLGADETAFQRAWKSIEARRRRIIIAVSVPVALLLAAAFAFWKLRRYQPPKVTVIQPLVLAQTAPGLPAPAAITASQTPLTLPAVVAQDYKLEESLGRDVFGFLYEGVEIPRNRKVFIRHLRPEISQAGSDLENLLAEARLAAFLKHPSIIEIYAVPREAEEVYLAFEPARGKALSDFIAQGQRVMLSSVKRLIRPAAAALDYAHAHKILHRDLKPANIWIAPGGAVKVADFGISHMARLAVAKRTRSESWGSDPYMAPEHEYGMLSRESDIFSLGVILYEMLTGSVPFTGPNFSAQKRELVYTPVSKALADMSVEIDKVILGALMPDPKKRYSSATEFAEAVGRLAG